MARDLLEEAKRLAREGHAGQEDKGGRDHIEHPLRVMEAVRPQGREATMVAVLHDLFEDTAASPARLRRLGFPQSVIESVLLLTKRADEKGSGEGYRRFIRRIAASGSRIALAVKLADLEDKLRLERLGRSPTACDLARVERYKEAQTVLHQALIQSRSGAGC